MEVGGSHDGNGGGFLGIGGCPEGAHLASATHLVS